MDDEGDALIDVIRYFDDGCKDFFQTLNEETTVVETRPSNEETVVVETRPSKRARAAVEPPPPQPLEPFPQPEIFVLAPPPGMRDAFEGMLRDLNNKDKRGSRKLLINKSLMQFMLANSYMQGQKLSEACWTLYLNEIEKNAIMDASNDRMQNLLCLGYYLVAFIKQLMAGSRNDKHTARRLRDAFRPRLIEPYSSELSLLTIDDETLQPETLQPETQDRTVVDAATRIKTVTLRSGTRTWSVEVHMSSKSPTSTSSTMAASTSFATTAAYSSASS